MKIFIAYPFTSKLQKNGLLPKGYVEELITLKKVLEDMGHKVVLAHEREKWGKNLLSPDICTKLDFDAISRADLIIAYPGNPPSGGVHIELGWASALGKIIIIIKKNNDNYSPLVEGLWKITSVTYILYTDYNMIVDKLGIFLQNRGDDVRGQREEI